MKNVLILQKSIPQYRIPFFVQLKEHLQRKGIHLQIVSGSGESDGHDNGLEGVAYCKRNKLVKVGRHSFIWQPCTKEIQKADLVIVEQANKLLINYVLLLRRFLFRKKFAFWGHGANLQDNRESGANRFKRKYSNYTDRWFAYTNGTRQRIADNGFEDKKITVVQNAIDTRQLKEQYKAITPQQISERRAEWSIREDEFVFIYCGALYKEKRIEFLIQAGDLLSDRGLKFKMIIVGDGADRNFLDEACKTRPWLIVSGARFGVDKALCFRLADVFLMPGAIGLAILDSFAFETPMITTDYEFHGPEFEYLDNGINGIVTKNTLEDYVAAVVNLVEDPQKLNSLKMQCSVDSSKYSIENMVSNFAAGIEVSLNDKNGN